MMDRPAASLDTIREQRRQMLAESGGDGSPPRPPLQFGGGGGTFDPMEARVTKLETHMEYVRRDLTSIDGKLDRVNEKLGQLPTRSDLRSWQWQWIATGVGIIALTVGGITGGLALIAKFVG